MTEPQREQALRISAQIQANPMEVIGSHGTEFRQVCDDCCWEEKAEESNSRPQTLADVGMCEADFR